MTLRAKHFFNFLVTGFLVKMAFRVTICAEDSFLQQNIKE